MSHIPTLEGEDFGVVWASLEGKPTSYAFILLCQHPYGQF